MFCNQCEQTSQGTGCTEIGVCGKDPDMQSLQEILLYGVKGMAAYAHHARRLGKSDPAVSEFIEAALFSTMTNVNFDLDSLLELVLECGEKNFRVMQLLDEAHTERRGFWSLATTFSTCPTCWNKRLAAASTSIRMARCCQLTVIPPCRHILIWRATTVRRGKTSNSSSLNSLVPLSRPRIAC